MTDPIIDAHRHIWRVANILPISVNSRYIFPFMRRVGSRVAQFAFAAALLCAGASAWGAPLTTDELNVLRERDSRYASVTPSPSALQLAGRIGREGNVDGFQAIIGLRNVSLLHAAIRSFDSGASRQLPEALETLIVENYADPLLRQPLLGLLAGRVDKLERFPKYRSRRLFDLLYADLRLRNADQFHFSIRIVATDLNGIEPDLIEVLPGLGSAAANELVMFLGIRKFAAAVPALIALQARTPFASDMNGLLQHINGALLQIGTPQAVQAVLDRMRALGLQSADPRAGGEIWNILLYIAALPAGSPPDYAEIRAALPAELNQNAWHMLIKLIAERKEKRGVPELIRALNQPAVSDEAVGALLAIGEPSDWQTGRAALERKDGGMGPDRLAALQKRLDEAIADPPKWIARRQRQEREQALQQIERQFSTDKNRLVALRTNEPQRYADAWRALIVQRETLLRDYSDLPSGVGAKQQLAREYSSLAAFMRFRLRQPDEAIAVYQTAARLQPAVVLDLTSLTIADIQRFDKRDPQKAIEAYRLALASMSRTSAATGSSDRLPVLALSRWIEREINYLEGGKPFSGTIGREDLAVFPMWMLLFGAMQQEMDPAVYNVLNDGMEAVMRGEKRSPGASDLRRTLDALPASQFQIAAAFMAAFQLPPADMLRFFARHDPAGYLTAVLLAVTTYRPPGGGGRGIFDLGNATHGAQDSVKSAADSFFRAHGIRVALAPEPRYASPEKTWALFIESAKKGDAAAMLACFTPNMREKLQGLFSNMSREDLRKMGESFVGFSVQKSDSDEIREAVIARQSGDRKTAGFVYFINVGGEWKIESM